MLTEKDYCDYETCVALKELGFNEPTLAYYHGFLSSKPLLYLVIDEDCMPKDGVNVFDLLSNSNKYKDSKNIDAPTMWEAQKWLREEKGVIVEVFVDDDSDTPITYNIYRYGACVCHHHGKYWSVKEWNEALAEGIKSAVKRLKDKQ